MAYSWIDPIIRNCWFLPMFVLRSIIIGLAQGLRKMKGSIVFFVISASSSCGHTGANVGILIDLPLKSEWPL